MINIEFKKIEFKKLLPFVIAILAFLVISYSYTPEVFKGEIVNQTDISSWRGMANEIIKHNETNPDDPTYWTNSMFSGMPAIPISVIYEGDFLEPIYKLFFIGERPASYIFISLVGAFLMFLAFGMNIYLAVLGSIAITFCSYNMQIIQVGHNSKMVAIALMPWVLAALVHTYRNSALWGSIFFAFTLSFQIKANHPQITYYLAIIVIGYAIAQLVMAIKAKALPKFIKTSSLILVCGLIGIATNINHLWPTYEFAKYTMRGGSELKMGNENSSGSGLDMDYATAWSYGIEEMPNLMIPNYNGGSSSGELDRSSETYKVLRENGQQGANQIIKQLPLYWGPQPFTAGPMYMGAISVFLFILGLLLYKGAIKWWVVGVSVLAVLLSWGSHFMFFSEIFFKYAPLYNKFRTVSMILIILQMTIPILGILVVDQILKGNYFQKDLKRNGIIALSITAGFALILSIIPSIAGDFMSVSDARLGDVLAQSIREDRADLLSNDAQRSFTFIMAAALVLYLGWAKRLKYEYTILILIAFMITDLWQIDKRYLNESHFVKEREFNNQFALRTVDKVILKDSDPNFRVLDLTIDPFNNSYISYHHKTIGGYSPAKLQRYQDMIQYYISPEIAKFGQDISSAKTLGDAEEALSYYPALSMLNTKYIIIDPSMPALENPYRLGNSWFVRDFRQVGSPDEEILSLAIIDPSKTAIISTDFNEVLSGLDLSKADSLANINLISYEANRLKYEYESETDNLALFSEVYYPKGWTASIDGEPVDIIRANYILRALKLPAGKHNIEFYFEPESISNGAIYSRISSGILLLLLLGVIGVEIRKRFVRIKTN